MSLRESLPTICGTTVGRTLGEGSYGKVSVVNIDGVNYAAKQSCDNLYQDGVCDPQEIDILSRLRHPYLTKVHRIITPLDCDDVDNLVYTMDLAVSTLSYKSLPYESVENKLKYLKQVFMGVQFLHDSHVLHLDLKEANILLFDEPEGKVAKVGDFGLAVYSTNGVYSSHRTLITITHRPPETFGRTKYENHLWSAASDVWSLGIMLYQLLTGKYFFNYTGDIEKNTPLLVQLISIPDATREEQLYTKLRSSLPEQLSRQAAGLLYFLLDPNPLTRGTIKYALSHPLFADINVPYAVGSQREIPAPLIANKLVEDETDAALDWLKEQRASTFFLTIDLLHRTSSLLRELTPTIHMWACGSLAIAMVEGVDYTVSDAEEKDRVELVDAQIKVIELLDGVLYRSYLWDSCKYVYQLQDLFREYVLKGSNYHTFQKAEWDDLWKEGTPSYPMLLESSLTLEGFISNVEL